MKNQKKRATNGSGKGRSRICAVLLLMVFSMTSVMFREEITRAASGRFRKTDYETIYLAINADSIHGYEDTTDGSVAYCLNSGLESPTGSEAYAPSENNGHLSESGMALVRGIIRDGYPLNSRYWAAKGIPEDAQRQATQLAIWSVLATCGEYESNHGYFDWGVANPTNRTEVDAVSMYRSLTENALTGKKIEEKLVLTEPKISLEEKEGKVTASFEVESENLSSYEITVGGLEEGTEVTLDGTPLSGTSFQMKPEVSDKRQFTLSFSIAENQKRTLELKAKGVKEEGQVTVFSPDDGAYQSMGKVEKLKEEKILEAKVQSVLPDEPGKIRVIKYDSETGTPLAGVRFGVFLPGEEKCICELVTGEDGSAESSYLADGNYEIRELWTPEGYIRFTGSETVTVVHGETTEKSLGNAPAKGEILLKKEAAGDESGFPGDSSLKGAVYKIFRLLTDGREESVGEIVTDEKGEGRFGGLALGAYIVREEKAPEGYWKDETEYRVDLTYQGDTEALVSEALTVKDERIKKPVLLKKYGEEGERIPLGGAGFSFYLKSSLTFDEEGNCDWRKAEPVEIGKEGETLLYTGEDGTLKTEPLPFGAYLIREVEAPEGYEPCRELEIFIGPEPGEEILTITAVDRKKPEEPETKIPETKPRETKPEKTEVREDRPRETTEEKNSTKTPPKTGDSKNAGSWIFIGSFSGCILLAAAVMLTLLKRKERQGRR